MEKAVLVELTSKQIKQTELIVQMCLFGSIAAGLGLMYLWFPLGIAMFCIAGIAFLAFCGVRVWRWWVNGSFSCLIFNFDGVYLTGTGDIIL